MFIGWRVIPCPLRRVHRVLACEEDVRRAKAVNPKRSACVKQDLD